MWGSSSFELAASYAVPYANIFPMSIHLEMTRAIAAVITTPVITDIDAGFGSALNVSYVMI
ncbi:isocitrate lyase/phosphoenolpyruvate mutase family protein [Sodalis-like endosymbiont of Proechinophthirus fluctus]|uniref:isocitrate lyase/phosphoenolpyruvate mutase family protein n=1 Tax=Sodalis-like endosymbiont of Proechinophthirus fluctus TaxID=1462730 RepID=UPI00210F930E|nr:isocitrate lyase/phosphoenolpyruvate mutase family protein [Sodalis-like endosymbiont of Proechinophthirus fluctus]